MASAAMGIASGVIAGVTAGPIDEEFYRQSAPLAYGAATSGPTAPLIYVSAVVAAVMALVTAGFGVGLMNLPAGTRAGLVIPVAWVLVGLSVVATCCSSTWLVGADQHADNFRAEALLASIPTWVTVSLASLMVGKIAALVAAAIMVSTRSAWPASPRWRPGPLAA